MRYVKLASLVGALTLAGCGVVPPPQVTVRLVNNSEFPVDVVLYYSDDPDNSRDVLRVLGQKLEFTLPANDPSPPSFGRNCDDLRAIVIDEAQLRVLGVGPRAQSNVLSTDGDFGCLSTITFTFDHTNAVTDFNVSSRVDR